MIALLGKVFCDSPEFMGAVQLRICDLAKEEGSFCRIYNVRKKDVDKISSMYEEGDITIFEFSENDGTKETDDECITDVEDLWIFNFQVDDFSLSKQIDDLLTFLYEEGLVIGYILDKLVPDHIIEQN